MNKAYRLNEKQYILAHEIFPKPPVPPSQTQLWLLGLKANAYVYYQGAVGENDLIKAVGKRSLKAALKYDLITEIKDD